MNKLTQLTNECLANMPMLADVICHTTNIIGPKIRKQSQWQSQLQ